MIPKGCTPERWRLLLTRVCRCSWVLVPGVGWQVKGDAGGGGVLAELGEGGDAGAGRVGDDAVLFQDRGDAAGGEADGGLVGAEQLFQQPAGHAEPGAAGGGGHDGLAGEPGGTAAAGFAAVVAAVQVQP